MTTGARSEASSRGRSRWPGLHVRLEWDRAHAMSVLQFIAALVQALAWPLVVLVALLLLRPAIAELLGREGLRRLKAGPLEAEWERELIRTEAQLDVASFGAPPPRPGTGDRETPVAVATGTLTDELRDRSTLRAGPSLPLQSVGGLRHRARRPRAQPPAPGRFAATCFIRSHASASAAATSAGFSSLRSSRATLNEPAPFSVGRRSLRW